MERRYEWYPPGLIAGRALNEDDVADVQDVDHDHEDRHDHAEAAYHPPRW